VFVNHSYHYSIICIIRPEILATSFFGMIVEILFSPIQLCRTVKLMSLIAAASLVNFLTNLRRITDLSPQKFPFVDGHIYFKKGGNTSLE
jgi:hypothetical protein